MSVHSKEEFTLPLSKGPSEENLTKSLLSPNAQSSIGRYTNPGESSETESVFLNNLFDDNPQNEIPDVNNFPMFLEEIWTIICFAFPSLWAQLAERSIITVPILFVGHLSTNELAGISLGRLFAAVTGLCILEGLAGGLDPYLPVVWKSRKPKFMGLWSQRMAIIMAIAVLPIIGLWLNAEIIFFTFIRIHILQQGPEVAQFAASYLRWFSLGMPAYAFNLIARRYFQAQGRFYVYSWTVSFVAIINLLMIYLLVQGPESVRLGFIGAPITTAVSYTLMSIISLISGIFFVPHDGWHPISSDILRNLGMISRDGFFSIMQIAPEWWAWEIMSFASSSFGSIALASQVVLTNTSAILYQVGAASIVNAAGVRVGNLLGDRRPKRAEISTNASFILSVTAGFITCSILLIFVNKWPYVFTSDKEVANMVTGILPVIAVYQIGEALSFQSAGILRAKGDQLLGAKVITCAYYVIGIPTGMFLAFYCQLKLLGLWLGITVSLFVSAAIGVRLCRNTDWDVEVQKAMNRVAAEDKLREGLMIDDEEQSIGVRLTL